MNIFLRKSVGYWSICILVSADIFTALENGVDVFDGSYAYSAAERGCAVVFPVVHDQKLQRLKHREDTDMSREICDVVEILPFEIDLSEERYLYKV